MKLRESYAALPGEGQQLLRDKQIEANWWPDDWIGFLGQMAEHDARADEGRNRTRGWMILTVIAAFVVAGLAFVASPVAGGVLTVLAIVWLIVAIVMYRRMKKTDLPGEHLRFGTALVTILKEDIAPDQGLRLRLDLRGPTHDAKRVHVSPEYQKGVYHKIIDTIYDDGWFDAGAQLVDDSRLHVRIFDRTRSQRKTKRNPRGKIKTKVKNKKTTYLQVELTLPRKNYAVNQQGSSKSDGPGGTATKVKVKPAQTKTAIKLTRTSKSTDVGSLPNPQEVVALIADAYGRGAPARRKKL